MIRSECSARLTTPALALNGGNAKIVHHARIGPTARTIASLLEAIRDESPPWRGVHGGNGIAGCGSYIPAEINSEQRGI